MELDKAKEIRQGEEIDINKLQQYLNEKSDLFSGAIQIKQFPSGFSNLTYLLSIGEKDYVLRKPPFGANIKSGHDMEREYKILSALGGNYNKAPKALLFCEEESILGAPFYIMERVEGVILRAQTPASELPSSSQFSTLAQNFTDTLVELHQLDYKAIGLEKLGKPEGYIERQVHGWSKRYLKAKTSENKAMEATAKWLQNNMPQQLESSLIHNDFKYDNLVLSNDGKLNIKAVLDWEMTTLGDPLMDLGTSLGYWIHHTDPDFLANNQFNLTTKKGNPTREELVELYAQKSGRSVDHIVFYFVFGVFKIAVIVQQIYYRYQKGYTQDPRFKHLDKVVDLYGILAQQAIQKNKLDRLF